MVRTVPILAFIGFTAAFSGFAAAIIGFAVTFSGFAAAAHADDADPSWPCLQRFVPTLSAAALWDGPPVDGIDWRADADVAALVDGLLAPAGNGAAPPEERINRFAATMSDPKTRNARLAAVFAGLLDRTNNDRGTILNGIRKQAAGLNGLAEQINALFARQGALTAAGKEESSPEFKETESQLYWLQRMFNERRKAQRYLCEEPVREEQRLGVLARALLNEIE